MTNDLKNFLEGEIHKFIENGADLEHDRWSKWQKYLHSLCIEHPKGMMIPWESWEHWERQIKTKYKELSDREKESDRHEVRTYLPLLIDHDTLLINFVLDLVEKEVEIELGTEFDRAFDKVSTIINNLKV